MDRRELFITWGMLVFSIIVLVILPFQVNFKAIEAKGSFITVTPATFPLLTVILMGGLSIFHLITLYRKRSKYKNSSEKGEEFSLKIVVLSVATLLIYTFLMDKLGFLIDTILLCTLMAIYFKAKLWQIIVSGVVMPVLIYNLFKLMYVYLPRGFWS